MRRPPVAVLAVLGGMAGCQWIGGVDDLSFSDATSSSGTGGASVSSSSVGGGGGSDSCELAQPPPRPTSSEGSGDESFVLAIRTMNFGEEDFDAEGNPLIGLDLDGRCTCASDEPLGCTLTKDAYADANLRCDGPGGRDNNFARFFRLLGGSGVTSDNLNEAVEAGGFSVLIHVSDYDGSANDAQVRVALYPVGLLSEGACLGAGGAGGAEPLPRPRWDGNDRWPVASSAIDWGSGTPPSAPECTSSELIASRPRFLDDNAYVADGVLVSGLSGLSFVAMTDTWSLPIELGQGFIVGRLERSGESWSIAGGTLAGRLSTASLFKSVSLASLNGAPICRNVNGYNLLRAQLCGLVDLPASFDGPSAPCDALSYAIEFSAVEADFGGVIPAEQLVSQCPPGADPGADSCG